MFKDGLKQNQNVEFEDNDDNDSVLSEISNEETYFKKKLVY